MLDNDSFVKDMASLTPSHKLGLQWFIDNQGSTKTFPAPLADGSLLATRGKGIYKPHYTNYALSVRIQLDSQYKDGARVAIGQNGWAFAYHEEMNRRASISSADNRYANRGLLDCLRDRVPVGIMRQIQKGDEGGSLYSVVGLGNVIEKYGAYFILTDMATASQLPSRVITQYVMEEQAQSETLEMIDPDVDLDGYESRVRTLRNIYRRQGQVNFRQILVEEYAGRCVISGCSTLGILDAAHIYPYRGSASNSVKNGLLLRTDFHGLFDLDLLGIHPATRTVFFHRDVQDDEYRKYSGAELRPPRNAGAQPLTEYLAHRWEIFSTSAEF